MTPESNINIINENNIYQQYFCPLNQAYTLNPVEANCGNSHLFDETGFTHYLDSIQYQETKCCPLCKNELKLENGEYFTPVILSDETKKNILNAIPEGESVIQTPSESVILINPPQQVNNRNLINLQTHTRIFSTALILTGIPSAISTCLNSCIGFFHQRQRPEHQHLIEPEIREAEPENNENTNRYFCNLL